eukprot:SAG31_NODE_1225_length_9271_cov_10.376472_5_plen_44_part_00
MQVNYAVLMSPAEQISVDSDAVRAVRGPPTVAHNVRKIVAGAR